MVQDETLEWLSSWHGYGVEAGGSRVGVVEDVLFGVEHGVVAALVVRGGLFGTRVRIVTAESVASVRPRSRRVVLRDDSRVTPGS